MKKNIITETINDTQKRAKNFLSPKNVTIAITCLIIGVLIIVIHNTKLIEIIESKSILLVRLMDSVAWITLGVTANFIGDFLLALTLRGSKRAITIEKLFHSCIKYIVAIIIIVALLIIWLGENYVKEVLGGLGILALIVGLGAQKLISDIIAGLFMVFEGHIEVGDIVTIGSFKGTVEEIGIRTTVLINAEGNLKIVTNSTISEYINMSQKLSVASCSCLISYDEDIEKVETIFKNALPIFKERIPSMTSMPDFKGVDSLDDSGYTIKISAECKECDRVKTQRALNKEILLLCNKENIEIPFPQLDIRQR